MEGNLGLRSDINCLDLPWRTSSSSLLVAASLKTSPIFSSFFIVRRDTIIETLVQISMSKFPPHKSG